MEPLVEVSSPREMDIALDCGARVVGVNNRDLHSFRLDMEVTARAVAAAGQRGFIWRPADLRATLGGASVAADSLCKGSRNDITSTLPGVSSNAHHSIDDPQNSCSSSGREVDRAVCIAALSGIRGPEDVRMFRDLGVSCCLVGESLMKAQDPRAAVQELLVGSEVDSPHTQDVEHNRISSGGDDETTDYEAHAAAVAERGAEREGGEEEAVGDTSRSSTPPLPIMVKICGLNNVPDALAALRSGASMLGILFAERSPRRVASLEVAADIARAVQGYGERVGPVQQLRDLALKSRGCSAGSDGSGLDGSTENSGGSSRGSSSMASYSTGAGEVAPAGNNCKDHAFNVPFDASSWFTQHSQLLRKITTKQPLLVGVFQDQTVEEVSGG